MGFWFWGNTFCWTRVFSSKSDRSGQQGRVLVCSFMSSHDQKKHFIVMSSIFYSLRVRAVIGGRPTFMSYLMKSFAKSLQRGQTLTTWYHHRLWAHMDDLCGFKPYRIWRPYNSDIAKKCLSSHTFQKIGKSAVGDIVLKHQCSHTPQKIGKSAMHSTTKCQTGETTWALHSGNKIFLFPLAYMYIYIYTPMVCSFYIRILSCTHVVHRHVYVHIYIYI